MIIGSGDIASVLKPKHDFIFIASGVSNSSCKDKSQFNREKNLIFNISKLDRRVVYFSSLSIFDKDTPYTRHKLEMESIIKNTCNRYCIIRLGNIMWGSNPHTVINFFKRKIKAKKKVDLKDEYKYICTLDEFKYWTKRIPSFNCEMNITGKRIHVKELYKKLKKNEPI